MKMLPLFAAATLMLPFAAAAQTPRGYVAVPAIAPAAASFIARETLWKCAGTACVASKPSGSNLTMCQLAAQRLGALTEFTANGTSFAPEQLTKCNARAK